jgi:hypothetical protein
MSSVQEQIVNAIQQKLVVTATYQGYERIMCPHIVGYKKGVLNAFFFQFAGGSKSGLPPGGQWRCIHVDDLAQVSCSPGEWHTKEDYAPSNCVDDVIAEVEL